MRTALAFLPPKPPCYEIQHGSGEEGSSDRLVYLNKKLEEVSGYRRAADLAEVHWATPRKGCQLPLVWLRPELGSESHVVTESQQDRGELPVLLHCHGNATDVGFMMDHYLELAEALETEVVGVEYSGYGAAGGSLDTNNIASDIEAAYDLVVAAGVEPRRIVVYGQSVGSAPAVHLAAARPVGGLVLHSPLASALKVIDRNPGDCCRPSRMLCCFDTFRNDTKISLVNCPVLIMHGRRDDVVPFHNAERLHRRCTENSRRPAHFIEKAGHNDLVEADFQGYFDHLSALLDAVRGAAAPRGAEPGEAGAPQQAKMRSSQDPEQRRHAGPEPVVGPTDGLYEQIRQGCVLPGVAQAKAESS